MGIKLDRDTQYEGYDNEDILQLKREISTLEHEVKEKRNRIAEIRYKCDHDYKFYCSGLYKDYYICCHCGKEIEK